MCRFIFSLIIVFAFCFSKAEIVDGQIYKKNTDRKELVFNFKNTLKIENGIIKGDSQYVDTQGKVALKVNSEFQDTRLIKYSLEDLQLNRKGSIVVEGKKVIFNFEVNGIKKTSETEDLGENFVVDETLLPYITKHWQELMDGKTLEVRIGVWDRQESVGFSLFKIGQEKWENKDTILLKFKPSSMLISALVDPLLFKLSTDGKQFYSMIGRVAPKIKDSNSWKDLDAEVIYQTTP